MKQCPACNRSYTDDGLSFCLEDGTPLVNAGADSSSSFDPSATLAFTPARETNPPPVNIYSPGQTPPSPAQPPWSPTPPAYRPEPQHARKSSTTPWIIGAIAAVIVLGIGLIVLLSIIGSQSKDSNKNSAAGVVNANSNSTISTKTSNTTIATSSTMLRDDFSTQNWPTGESAYGSYYQDGQYHMKAKPELYVFMFPRLTGNYASKDAIVKVTVRSVSGTSPEYGYGLIMHGKVNSKGSLEGYGFFIYTGATPGYQIVHFTNGEPNALVKWTNSSVIRTGTSPNQIEVRARGSQLNMYVNGQLLKGVTDTSNVTDGFVGLYTSETPEVAFDDLEIDRGASATN
jgi:hypothetical protein